MTRARLITILIAAAIVVPGLFLIGMRAGVRTPSVKKGWINPVLTIPRALFGGTVREVLAKTGDRVESGQVLVRFEAGDLETRLMQLRKAAHAAEAAVKGGNAMAQIPNQVRQYLYEMHPDTVNAEREYVDALAASDPARLRRATEERMAVRRSLGQLFADRANAGDSQVYLAEIARNIAEVEKLLRDAEVRAPSSAVVDLLDAHIGEKFQPGQPVAVLISAGEYSVQLGAAEAELTRLHSGMSLKGRLEGGGTIDAKIESISMRKLPVIARDNLQAAEEPVVRLRIVSAVPLRAGTAATFELP